MVDDTKISLLQIVQMHGDHECYLCERYDIPTYSQVQCNNISNIKIHITDDTERKIPFQAGKTIVTLHPRNQGFHIQ